MTRIVTTLAAVLDHVLCNIDNVFSEPIYYTGISHHTTVFAFLCVGHGVESRKMSSRKPVINYSLLQNKIELVKYGSVFSDGVMLNFLISFLFSRI